MSDFLRNYQTFGRVVFFFFQSGYSILHSNRNGCHILLRPWQNAVLSLYFYFIHSNSSTMINYCFNLHLFNDYCTWIFFLVLICQLYIFFGEISVHIFCSLDFFIYWISRVFFFFKILVSWICGLRTLAPILSFVFYPLNRVFPEQFDELQLINFFLAVVYAFGVKAMINFKLIFG